MTYAINLPLIPTTKFAVFKHIDKKTHKILCILTKAKFWLFIPLLSIPTTDYHLFIQADNYSLGKLLISRYIAAKINNKEQPIEYQGVVV